MKQDWYILLCLIGLVLVFEIFYLFRIMKFHIGYMSLPLSVLSVYYFEVLRKNISSAGVSRYFLIILGLILLLRLFGLFIMFRWKHAGSSYAGVLDYKAILASILIDFVLVFQFFIGSYA